MKSDEILVELIPHIDSKFCPEGRSVRTHKCRKFVRCPDCILDWARNKADEKDILFTEEEKTFWMWIYTCHEANFALWPKEKIELLNSIDKKIMKK